jgi:hypothetical protein
LIFGLIVSVQQTTSDGDESAAPQQASFSRFWPEAEATPTKEHRNHPGTVRGEEVRLRDSHR